MHTVNIIALVAFGLLCLTLLIIRIQEGKSWGPKKKEREDPSEESNLEEPLPAAHPAPTASAADSHHGHTASQGGGGHGHHKKEAGPIAKGVGWVLTAAAVALLINAGAWSYRTFISPVRSDIPRHAAAANGPAIFASGPVLPDVSQCPVLHLGEDHFCPAGTHVRTDVPRGTEVRWRGDFQRLVNEGKVTAIDEDGVPFPYTGSKEDQDRQKSDFIFAEPCNCGYRTAS